MFNQRQQAKEYAQAASAALIASLEYQEAATHTPGWKAARALARKLATRLTSDKALRKLTR